MSFLLFYAIFNYLNFLRLQKWRTIILLDKLDMRDKFIWYLIENIDKGAVDTNRIEL